MDRGLLKQHLLLAEKHIGEGVVHVERQRQIVEGLERDGQDVGRSADLLELFEETLRAHINERERGACRAKISDAVPSKNLHQSQKSESACCDTTIDGRF